MKTQKFSNDTINYIKDAILVSSLLGIEAIRIDRESFRGENKELGIFAIKSNANTTLEFDDLAITRVQVLKTRLNLFDANASIEPQYKEKDNGRQVLCSLKIKNNKTSIDFKCAEPSMVVPRKTVNDPVYFSFTIDQDTIKLLSKAQSAMSSTTIIISSEDGESVTIKQSDVEGDMLKHVLDTVLIPHNKEEKDKFSASYNLKILLPILKDAVSSEELLINITRRGVLSFNVRDVQVYIIPEI